MKAAETLSLAGIIDFMGIVTCIYCLEPADSIEHALPAAFGEFDGALLLKDRICRKCNGNKLGLLDEQLTRSGPEAFFRRLYGVTGRAAHEKVNPFERGSAGAQRLDARAVDPKLGFEVGFELENGKFRQSKQIAFIEKSGKAHHIPIREGMTPEQLLNAYNKLDVKKPFDSYVFADPDERVWIEDLIKRTWPSVTSGDSAQSSTNYEGLVVNFELTERYFRAIAKIGFHYFLTQFSQYRGDEEVFSDIRQYIWEGGGGVDRANQFIGVRQTPLLGEMLPEGSRPDGWQAHVLCAEIRVTFRLSYLKTGRHRSTQSTLRATGK